MTDVQHIYTERRRESHESETMTRHEDIEMCDMRGMLSFMILWLLSKRPMYGQELAAEIGKRRGSTPNPGTIYPALKHLSGFGVIEARSAGRNKIYHLTDQGQRSLNRALEYFREAFGEIFYSTAAVRQGRRMKGD